MARDLCWLGSVWLCGCGLFLGGGIAVVNVLFFLMRVWGGVCDVVRLPILVYSNHFVEEVRVLFLVVCFCVPFSLFLCFLFACESILSICLSKSNILCGSNIKSISLSNNNWLK